MSIGISQHYLCCMVHDIVPLIWGQGPVAKILYLLWNKLADAI